jgi:hypothetical protein
MIDAIVSPHATSSQSKKLYISKCKYVIERLLYVLRQQ